MLSSFSVSFSFVVSANDANRAVSKLLLLGTLLLDQHLVVGQDVLHEVVATTESIFILDSCFQVDAVVVCILHQFQTHSWFHVG